jgi:hypothetical protein
MTTAHMVPGAHTAEPCRLAASRVAWGKSSVKTS